MQGEGTRKPTGGPGPRLWCVGLLQDGPVLRRFSLSQVHGLRERGDANTSYRVRLSSRPASDCRKSRASRELILPSPFTSALSELGSESMRSPWNCRISNAHVPLVKPPPCPVESSVGVTVGVSVGVLVAVGVTVAVAVGVVVSVGQPSVGHAVGVAGGVAVGVSVCVGSTWVCVGVSVAGPGVGQCWCAGLDSPGGAACWQDCPRFGTPLPGCEANPGMARPQNRNPVTADRSPAIMRRFVENIAQPLLVRGNT